MVYENVMLHHQCNLAVFAQFLSGLHIMDYSLIVGIHDCTVEDKQQRNTFPVPADEEEDEEEGLAEEVQEECAEEEENGVDEDGEGVPTPPDSPQPITPMPPFNGELDGELERFGVRSAEGKCRGAVSPCFWQVMGGCVFFTA